MNSGGINLFNFNELYATHWSAGIFSALRLLLSINTKVALPIGLLSFIIGSVVPKLSMFNCPFEKLKHKINKRMLITFLNCVRFYQTYIISFISFILIRLNSAMLQ